MMRNHRSTRRKCFNPRPREGGDCAEAQAASHWPCFNPRPREGGDGAACTHSTILRWFQSTPPRGGRPPFLGLFHHRLRVSIHAPARGATAAMFGNTAEDIAFQSTPPRGGRPIFQPDPIWR